MTSRQQRHKGRTETKPFLALRPDSSGELDDVVVKGVEMFRAEMMSDSALWLCCYLTDGERVTWWVSAGKNHSAKLNFSVTETPSEADYEEGSIRDVC